MKGFCHASEDDGSCSSMNEDQAASEVFGLQGVQMQGAQLMQARREMQPAKGQHLPTELKPEAHSQRHQDTNATANHSQPHDATQTHVSQPSSVEPPLAPRRQTLAHKAGLHAAPSDERAAQPRGAKTVADAQNVYTAPVPEDNATFSLLGAMESRLQTFRVITGLTIDIGDIVACIVLLAVCVIGILLYRHHGNVQEVMDEIQKRPDQAMREAREGFRDGLDHWRSTSDDSRFRRERGFENPCC